MSEVPAIRYARTADNLDIAYWRHGRGPALVHTPNIQFSHIRSEWQVDGVRRWYEALARSFELVRYDHRGGGLSTRCQTAVSVDALVRDLETVADAVSRDPLVLFGSMTGGLPAIAYAARHPDRVSHLVLWSSFARNEAHGLAPRLKSLFQMAAQDWELFTESIAQAALGWSDAQQARQWAAVERDATTQDEFLAFLESRRRWDVSQDLKRVTAPTLILHDKSNALASEERSRELATGIRHSHFQLCDSDGGFPGPDGLETILSFVGRNLPGAAVREILTAREQEVLGLLATGATNAEIAKRLFISIHTVTRHLTHIYAKTETNSRAQAVRYALERGIGAS